MEVHQTAPRPRSPIDRRRCIHPPIIRINVAGPGFVMSCWYCNFRVEVPDPLRVLEAQILKAKHDIREW